MKLKDKVLVVEDEQNISNFITTVLSANEFDVLVAQTGSEAISMISSHCPDLIILDLGLPDMDGLNILEEVRSWSNLPIIVVSARTHENDKVTALDLGADDYIEKPFGTSELLARIRTAIRHTRTSLDNGEIAQSPDVAWCVYNSNEATHEVGTKTPNELGLYDMTGNVSEWVVDQYDKDTRFVKGGSWADDASNSVITSTEKVSAKYKSGKIGFRVCQDE